MMGTSEPDDCSFVWDENSQLHFHVSSGFYHDPVAGWYYSGRDGLYYKFENGNYVLMESETSGEGEIDQNKETGYDNPSQYETIRCGRNENCHAFQGDECEVFQCIETTTDENRLDMDPHLARPSVSTVLTRQAKHRSSLLWDGPSEGEEFPGVLTCRHRFIGVPEGGLDPRVAAYITNAGLGGLLWVPDIELDHALITVLVERWRPETYSFHLPHGKLQNISLPPVKLHCSMLAEDAIKVVVKDYEAKRAKSNGSATAALAAKAAEA